MKFRAFLFLILCLFSVMNAQDSPRLLIKIPTRENPDQFISTLDMCYENLSGQVDYQVLITCDSNDSTMNNPDMIRKLSVYPNLTVVFGDRLSKIEAYNRDLNELKDTFEVLLVGSDKTFPTVFGYDKLIVQKMQANFPDYDGLLNFQSSDTGKNVITTPVIGKNLYALFGYVYNPDYKTTHWSKEELTIVSRMLAREALILHPLFSKDSPESLKSTIEKIYTICDRQTYQKRFNTEFGLTEDIYKPFIPKLWSIMICTLDERAEVFSFIYNKLNRQIIENGLEDQVEILWFKDNREHSIGYKRNALMRQSRGMYVNFVDDDDDVHQNYIKMIYEALATKPDCVSMTGIITFDGNWPCKFIHGVEYKSHYKENDIFYNPPNHLNTIKRSVASRFPFLDISYGEDLDWSMQICRSTLLKTEAKVTTPFYFYKYVTK